MDLPVARVDLMMHPEILTMRLQLKTIETYVPITSVLEGSKHLAMQDQLMNALVY